MSKKTNVRKNGWLAVSPCTKDGFRPSSGVYQSEDRCRDEYDNEIQCGWTVIHIEWEEEQ